MYLWCAGDRLRLRLLSWSRYPRFGEGLRLLLLRRGDFTKHTSTKITVSDKKVLNRTKGEVRLPKCVLTRKSSQTVHLPLIHEEKGHNKRDKTGALIPLSKMKIETLSRFNMFETTLNSSISPFSCITLQVEVNFFNTLILHQWKFSLQNRRNSFRVFRANEARSRRGTQDTRDGGRRRKKINTQNKTRNLIFFYPFPGPMCLALLARFSLAFVRLWNAKN